MCFLRCKRCGDDRKHIQTCFRTSGTIRYGHSHYRYSLQWICGQKKDCFDYFLVPVAIIIASFFYGTLFGHPNECYQSEMSHLGVYKVVLK